MLLCNEQIDTLDYVINSKDMPENIVIDRLKSIIDNYLRPHKMI